MSTSVQIYRGTKADVVRAIEELQHASFRYQVDGMVSSLSVFLSVHASATLTGRSCML